MKVIMGNHIKIHVHTSLRQHVKDFYTILGCESIQTPFPNIERFEFQGGFVLGIEFVEKEGILSEEDQLKGTWLELIAKEPEQLKKRLIEFGVKEVDYQDKSRFYFQAPGGQVFRIASPEAL